MEPDLLRFSCRDNCHMITFHWAEVREALMTLKTAEIDEQSAGDYAQALDSLEAQIYDQQSRLERESRSNPRDEPARQALIQFLTGVDTESKAIIGACTERLRPYFASLPDEWKPCLHPFIFEEKLAEDVGRLMGEIAATATEFSRIDNSIRYVFDDSDEDPMVLRFSSDEQVRARAFRAVLQSEVRKEPEFQDLFRRLHTMRTAAARQAGFQNYLEMAWASENLAERDYTRSDLHEVHQLVKRFVCPLLVTLRGYRAALRGTPTFQPSDFGARIARPGVAMKDVTALQAEIHSVLSDLSPRLASLFRHHDARNMYAIAGLNDTYRPGYSNYLPSEHLGWMTCWYGHSPDTLCSVVHEIGHTLYWASVPKERLFRQHFPSTEYAEFVPQLLETLVTGRMNAFQEERDDWYMQFSFLEKALKSMVERCLMDEFQEQVYQMDDISSLDLGDLYLNLLTEYPDGIDYSAVSPLNKSGWVSWQVFQRPFYGIEYTLAWFAALNWYGDRDIDTQTLEWIFSRCQDAPTGKMFADLGLRLIPDEASAGEWFAHLSKQVAGLAPRMG